MALRSDLFKGDARLEAAAASDGSHIKSGDRGPFVAKIQNALNQLDKAGLDEDGKYGTLTAKAVRKYKSARGIINRAYQTQADDIVGKMTVAAMDEELAKLSSSIVPLVVIGRPILDPRPAPSFRPVPAIFRVKSENDSPSDVPPPPSPVKISAVIRANPHVIVNGQPFPGVPASVPPNKTYIVDVSVLPPPPAVQAIEIEIINTSDVNGHASVTPTSLKGSGSVTVRGTRQTEPGHAGNLRFKPN